MTIAQVATVETPIAPFTIIALDDVVLASGWTTDAARLLNLIHPTLQPDEVQERTELGDLTKAVTAYHEGDVAAIEEIEVHQIGGDFLRAAWAALRKVSPGHPVSYTQLAELAGKPAAIRAAGTSCARNAAALFVPCHRVVRADGSIGNFGYGVSVKRWLLGHEAPAVEFGR